MRRSHLPLPGKLILLLLMLAAIFAVGYMAWPVLAYRDEPSSLPGFHVDFIFQMVRDGRSQVTSDAGAPWKGPPIVGMQSVSRFTGIPIGHGCFWYGPSGRYFWNRYF